jgi:hypothetical protein
MMTGDDMSVIPNDTCLNDWTPTRLSPAGITRPTPDEA